MLVKDLIEKLQQCDPYGYVDIEKQDIELHLSRVFVRGDKVQKELEKMEKLIEEARAWGNTIQIGEIELCVDNCIKLYEAEVNAWLKKELENIHLTDTVVHMNSVTLITE